MTDMDTLITYTFAIIAALLPIALLFFYIYWQDKKQPEPARWLWGGFLLGTFSAIAAILIMKQIPYMTEAFPTLSGTTLGSALDAFACAAIPEELLKFLMLWLLLRRNPYYDEHLDGIVYAACVGLGFASLENALYLLQNLDDIGYVASMRAIFAVPGHFCFAIAMGYYYSRASFCPTALPRRKWYLGAMALAIPILLHGAYDSIVMSIAVNGEVWYICALIVLLLFCHMMLRKGQQRIWQLKQLDLTNEEKEPVGSK